MRDFLIMRMLGMALIFQLSYSLCANEPLNKSGDIPKKELIKECLHTPDAVLKELESSLKKNLKIKECPWAYVGLRHHEKFIEEFVSFFKEAVTLTGVDAISLIAFIKFYTEKLQKAKQTHEEQITNVLPADNELAQRIRAELVKFGGKPEEFKIVEQDKGAMSAGLKTIYINPAEQSKATLKFATAHEISHIIFEDFLWYHTFKFFLDNYKEFFAHSKEVSDQQKVDILTRFSQFKERRADINAGLRGLPYVKEGRINWRNEINKKKEREIEIALLEKKIEEAKNNTRLANDDLRQANNRLRLIKTGVVGMAAVVGGCVLGAPVAVFGSLAGYLTYHYLKPKELPNDTSNPGNSPQESKVPKYEDSIVTHPPVGERYEYLTKLHIEMLEAKHGKDFYTKKKYPSIKDLIVSNQCDEVVKKALQNFSEGQHENLDKYYSELSQATRLTRLSPEYFASVIDDKRKTCSSLEKLLVSCDEKKKENLNIVVNGLDSLRRRNKKRGGG